MRVQSQSSLQDYLACARRYELRYVHQLRYPSVEAEPIETHELYLQQGEDFHRLVQQHLLGIPADRLTATITDATLLGWWQAYLADGLRDLPPVRLPEVTLYTVLGGVRLMAKYDVLAIDAGQQIVIVDWKTNRKRPTEATLRQRLQTLVYRYVLVEAGRHLNQGAAILPDQVSMRYWFANFPQAPITLTYDAAEHAATGELLAGLIREVETRTVFDLTDDVSQCLYCVYRSLCKRGDAAGQGLPEESESWMGEADVMVDFDQIAEIEF